jgi:hypothetical protein
MKNVQLFWIILLAAIFFQRGELLGVAQWDEKLNETHQLFTC